MTVANAEVQIAEADTEAQMSNEAKIIEAQMIEVGT